jgi:hypothetical protein
MSADSLSGNKTDPRAPSGVVEEECLSTNSPARLYPKKLIEEDFLGLLVL